MMGIAERMSTLARSIAAATQAMPLTKALTLHASHLKELRHAGVSFPAFSKALEQAGILTRSGKAIDPDNLRKAIANAIEVAESKTGLGLSLADDAALLLNGQSLDFSDSEEDQMRRAAAERKARKQREAQQGRPDFRQTLNPHNL